jgi:hypothetical protein
MAPLIGVLAIGLLVAIANMFMFTFLDRWDGPIHVNEAINIFFANHLAEGRGLYRHWGPHQWLYPAYQPGFYLIYAPLTWLTHTSLTLPRLFSDILMAFTAAGVGAAASALRAPRLFAAASALACFSFVEVVGLVAYAKPDAPALLFLAWGLVAVIQWERTAGRRQLVMTGIFAVAMITTKINFAPVACAWLVAVGLKDRRLALALSAGVALGVILVFGATQLLTGGAFFDDMRGTNAGFSLIPLKGALKDSLLPYPNPLLLLAAAAVTSRFRALRGVELTWLGSLGVLASAVHVGAASNYWIPLELASAVLLGPTLFLARPGSKALGVLSVLIAAGLLPQQLSQVNGLRSVPGMLASFDAQNREAAFEMTQVKGRILSDRVDLQVVSGHEPELDNYVFSIMADNAIWNPDEAAAAVRRHEYLEINSVYDLRGPHVSVLGADWWPDAVVAAVQSSYCLKSHDAIQWVYRPC